MRFLILGDSLTLGRPNYKIWYEDTWPGLLEKQGYKIFHRGSGGSDSAKVLREAKHLEGYMIAPQMVNTPFDICFVHVGIVDCTPRLFPRRINQMLSTLPFGRRLISRVSRNQALTQRIGRPWIDKLKFKKNILSIFLICSRLADKVVFIEIARPTHFLVENCGDFASLVDQYNIILKRSGGFFLSVYDQVELGDHLLPDGHHLNHNGHRNITSKITKMIETFSHI